MKDYPIVYKCNPEKNTNCKKTLCQKDCFFTYNKDYSEDGKRYKYNADTDKTECMVG